MVKVVIVLARRLASSLRVVDSSDGKSAFSDSWRDTRDSTQHIAQFATNSVKASAYAHMCACVCVCVLSQVSDGYKTEQFWCEFRTRVVRRWQCVYCIHRQAA